MVLSTRGLLGDGVQRGGKPSRCGLKVDHNLGQVKKRGSNFPEFYHTPGTCHPNQ